MIKKVTKPIIERFSGNSDVVVGTIVEYRLFGIMLYSKELHTPEEYGIHNYNNYQIRI